MPKSGVARDDLARVDSQAGGQGDTVIPLELGAQAVQALVHLDRGAYGAQRVVLVRARDPKTAMTASPMNFSTLPPCRSTTALISS